MRAPLAIRTRLLVVVSFVVLVSLVLATGAFSLLLRRSLEHDATALARARAAATLATIDARGPTLKLRETPDDAAVDSWAWVVDSNGRVLEQPNRASSQTTAAVVALAASSERGSTDSDGLRVAAEPIVADGRHVGVVVAGVTLAPYERTIRIALIGSILLGVVLLAVVILASRWILARALAPVSRMTHFADEWVVEGSAQRFAPGEPHDELSELAATLDRLLDRVQASFRREQRFGAELAHELRTPLSRILAEVELAGSRERDAATYRAALSSIDASARQVERTIDTLIAAARHEATPEGARGSCDVAGVLRRLVETADARAGVAVEVLDATSPCVVAAERDLVERIVAPILENGLRNARSRVELTAAREQAQVVISVTDDGEGIDPIELEHLFEPGIRGRRSAGAGLGLSLARRLARSADGDVTFDDQAMETRFCIRLPNV